jgi:hypothetical protein
LGTPTHFTGYRSVEIPVFDIMLSDEDDGVDRISFVTQPAIGVNWMAFSDERVSFQMASEEERKVFGPVLIPNQNILRRNDQGEPFFIRWSAETIETVRDRFMLQAAGTEVNGEHTSMMLDRVFMIESFIKNAGRGMLPPKEFNHLPDGTWFGMFKVNNDQVWNDYIKTGTFMGFSVEAWASLKDNRQTVHQEDLAFKAELEEIYDLINSMQK